MFIEDVEKMLTEFLTQLAKLVLFFCSPKLQSTIVTVIHYIIFIIGIYLFYFVVKPRSTYKIFFLLFAILSYIGYLAFDKCICSSVEYALYDDVNFIQCFMKDKFGDGEEGKTVSKSNLFMISLFLGLSVLYDYRGIFNKVCGK
jgi:hypothetical protein